MKKRTKAKTSKHSPKKSVAPSNELSELVAAMTRVAERLEALEKRIEQVIPLPVIRHSEPVQADQPVRRPEPLSPSQPPQHSEPGHRNQRHPRGRVLHKAVCADCKQDCEIPFKPTGERPVYCKSCFSKRKAGGSIKPKHDQPLQESQPVARSVSEPVEPLRRVTVTKKGVGKVTVSEIIRPSASPISREASHKKKHGNR